MRTLSFFFPSIWAGRRAKFWMVIDLDGGDVDDADAHRNVRDGQREQRRKYQKRLSGFALATWCWREMSTMQNERWKRGEDVSAADGDWITVESLRWSRQAETVYSLYFVDYDE